MPNNPMHPNYRAGLTPQSAVITLLVLAASLPLFSVNGVTGAGHCAEKKRLAVKVSDGAA